MFMHGKCENGRKKKNQTDREFICSVVLVYMAWIVNSESQRDWLNYPDKWNGEQWMKPYWYDAEREHLTNHFTVSTLWKWRSAWMVKGFFGMCQNGGKKGWVNIDLFTFHFLFPRVTCNATDAMQSIRIWFYGFENRWCTADCWGTAKGILLNSIRNERELRNWVIRV